MLINFVDAINDANHYTKPPTGLSPKSGVLLHRGMAPNRRQTNVDRAVIDTDVAPVATGSASSLPAAVGSRFGPPYWPMNEQSWRVRRPAGTAVSVGSSALEGPSYWPMNEPS